MNARTVRIPVTDRIALEGRFVERGEHAAVIAPPHPLYGGSIGNPVVRSMETALHARGLTTLAFNYRGIGDSDGEPSGDNEDGRADYRAALRFLNGRKLVWLCGYSFGGVLALSLRAEVLSAHVLAIAPPVAMTCPTWLRSSASRTVWIVGAHDPYALEDDVRELVDGSAVELSVLQDVDHFFLGSGVEKLSECLATLAITGE